MSIPSLRLYKTCFFVYLTILFFGELLLPLRYPFPLLTVGLAIAPLFFGFGYSIIVAGFWGVVMGVISYRAPFLYAAIYGINVLSVVFLIKKLDHKLLLYVSTAVITSVVYGVSVGAVGELPLLKLIFLVFGMSLLGVLQAHAVEHIIYYRHD